MTQRFAVVPAQPPAAGDETEVELEILEGFDPGNVFALIEQTASTIRRLRQENERIARQEEASRASIAEREEASRATIEKDRAQWREDVERLKTLAGACLERAVSAESEAEAAETQTRAALSLAREAEERERAAEARAAAAVKRAESAEQWLDKINRALSSDIRTLLRE